MSDEITVSDPIVEKPKRKPLPWPSGRIGRVRYIANVVGLALLCTLGISVLGSLLAMLTEPEAGMPVLTLASKAVFYGVLPAGLLFWSVERSHDAGLSGWFALLVLLPGINLLFWLWPGKRGENRFGPVPKPAGKVLTGIVMAVLCLFVLMYGYNRMYGPTLPERPAKPTTVLPAYPG